MADIFIRKVFGKVWRRVELCLEQVRNPAESAKSLLRHFFTSVLLPSYKKLPGSQDCRVDCGEDVRVEGL